MEKQKPPAAAAKPDDDIINIEENYPEATPEEELDLGATLPQWGTKLSQIDSTPASGTYFFLNILLCNFEKIAKEEGF